MVSDVLRYNNVAVAAATAAAIAAADTEGKIFISPDKVAKPQGLLLPAR